MAWITPWFDARYTKRLILAVVLALISVGQLSAYDKPAKPRGLTAAMQEIDRVIAESTKKSSTYKIHGQLLTTDLGSRVTSWSRPKRFLIDDFARHLRTLFFYAVCREHPAALETLARIDGLILGGLLHANERLYLTELAQRRTLSIRFPPPWRALPAPPDTDLRSIKRHRRLTAALAAGQLKTARRLLPGFALLCR